MRLERTKVKGTMEDNHSKDQRSPLEATSDRNLQTRAGTDSTFSGFELFWVSNFWPELRSGTWECCLEPIEPMNIFELYTSPENNSIFQALSS